ncbi:alpha/beta hydrolase (plasmid) [Sulfitobacter sp. LCG007]
MANMQQQGKTRAARVRKGHLDVRGRPLHYVRQGSGPAVVLLHASPCSARVMAPLQDLWSAEFTTFAFDLPGFGLSGPPDADEVTIPLLADIVAEGMRQLGIGQAALYGRHTGASVALAIAVQHPDLAALLVTDGLPIFAEPYSDERLERYLAPIEPAADGTHLPWTLFRYREQHVFWPWDAKDLAHRASADLPDIDFLHRGMLDMIEAAETYAPTYRAAFRYSTLDHIGGLRCPAVFGNRPGDSQFKTIRMYPEGAPVRVISRDPEAAAQEEFELLRLTPATGEVPEWRHRFGAANAVTDYLPTRHGVVYAIGRSLEADGMPRLFLPDMPGAAQLHGEEIAALAGDGPVLAIDLGGMGNSDIEAPVSLELWLEQIDDVVEEMGWPQVELVGNGLGGTVAAAFAAHRPERVRALLLRSPALLTDEERAAFRAHPAPEILPVADGGYLLRLWHHLRDQELWWPWFDTSHRGIRKAEPQIAAGDLNRRAIAILKQPQHYAAIWSLLIDRDPAADLASLSQPVRIVSDPSDVFAPVAHRHAGCAG